MTSDEIKRVFKQTNYKIENGKIMRYSMCEWVEPKMNDKKEIPLDLNLVGRFWIKPSQVLNVMINPHKPEVEFAHPVSVLPIDEIEKIELDYENESVKETPTKKRGRKPKFEKAKKVLSKAEKKIRGKRAPYKKISEAEADLIKERLHDKVNPYKIAQELGIKLNTLHYFIKKLDKKKKSKKPKPQS